VVALALLDFAVWRGKFVISGHAYPTI